MSISPTADTSRIQRTDSGGNFVKSVGIDGKPYIMTDGYYNAPTGIDVDEEGNMLILEAVGLRLIKTDSAGNQLWTFGGPLTSELGYNGPEGNPSFAPDERSSFRARKTTKYYVLNGVYWHPGSEFRRGRHWQLELQGPMGIDIRPLEDGSL